MTQATPSPDELHDKSITKFDNTLLPAEGLAPSAPGGVLHITLPYSYLRTPSVLPMDLPPVWSRSRDYLLSSTITHNDMWASAVAWAISKQISLDWTVTDNAQSERRTEKARQLLLQANKGAGWGSFLTQHLTDYCLTDNGAFVEIIWSEQTIRRAPDGSIVPTGRILGIQHLDSVRCTRTHDIDLYPYRDYLAAYWKIKPEEVHSSNFPVIYTDLAGRFHTLWRWQVMAFSDMTSPRAELRGTGLCAASRAYHAIFKDTSMERYVSEKITGHAPKEIHLVSGIMAKQFEDATQASLDQTRSENRQMYRGVVVIPGIKPDAGVSGYRIPIAEIPDGFDPVAERTNTYNKYAKALGLPAGDLERAPAGLNSGQTAKVEADQAEGTGLAGWRKAWVHAINEWLLPHSTQFEWTGDSLSDQLLLAQIRAARAQTRQVMIQSGYLTPAQALQLAVDDGDLPDEFIPEDETTQDSLRDDEKLAEAPSEGEGNIYAAQVSETPQAPAQQGQGGPPRTFGEALGQKAPGPDEAIEYVDGIAGALLKITTKKAETEADEIEAVYSEALRWARKALEGD